MITEATQITRTEICPEWFFSVVTGVLFEQKIGLEDMCVVVIY